jgi:hypothetical protein
MVPKLSPRPKPRSASRQNDKSEERCLAKNRVQLREERTALEGFAEHEVRGAQDQVVQPMKHVDTASGKIRCLRCTARSTRTGLQCGRPALKASRTQKCQFHGGRGSGPKTAEGRASVAAARTVHGRETRQARAERSAASAKLSQLEDAAYVLGMMDGPRARGRKAAGYVPLGTLDDVKQMVTVDLLNRIGATPADEGDIERKTLRPAP